MLNNKRFILPVAFLILTVLACNTVQAVPLSTVDAVGTAAALTVTAKLGSQPQDTTPAAPATAAAPTTPPSVPTNTPIPSATPICDQAKFISETIPDGSVFAPGASFTKSWRLQNTGNCTWTSSYAVVFESGDMLSAPAAVPLGGNVAPGQEVDLPVNMVAPGAPGSYTGYWRMRNASGVLFGTTPGNANFWVKITVVAPTLTPTSSGAHILPIIPIVPLLLAPSTQQVYAQVTVPAGGIGHAVVACPSGSIVTGGGYASNQYQIVYTQSATGNSWEAYSKNTSGSSQLLNAYAICLSYSSGSTQQVYASATAPAGGIGHAVVACPAGTIVTGGGYASNQYQVVYTQSESGNGWEAYTYNPSGSDQLVNAYAICLSGTSATSQQVYAQVTVPASGVGHAEVACPSGSVLTGGGYASNKNQIVYTESATGSSWQAASSNTSASSQLLNAYAICTTFP